MTAPGPRRSAGARRATITAIVALALAGCASSNYAPRPLARAKLTQQANAGNAIAEYALGLREFAQSEDPSSQHGGLLWIRKAADQGLACAQHVMGVAYLRGRGVPRSATTAIDWFRMAATRGAPASQLKLAALYAAGKQVPQDLARAYYWYAIAAQPVVSDIRIANIREVRAFARDRMQSIRPALSPDQAHAIDLRVAAWQPTPSIRYRGTVAAMNLR